MTPDSVHRPFAVGDSITDETSGQPNPTGCPFQDRRPWTVLSGILLLQFFLYFPVTRNEFVASDDYFFLSHAARFGLSMAGIFEPYNGHVIPIYRLLFALQFKCFGLHPAGYYVCGILLHLAVTALVAVLLLLISKSRSVALASAAFFGFSAAHWQPLLLVLSSNTTLATLGFIGSAVCFVLHLRSSRPGWLVASFLSQTFAFFSFSFGLEIPVLFFALYLAVKDGEPLRLRIKGGLLYFFLFSLNLGLLLALRGSVLSRFPDPNPIHMPRIGVVFAFIPEAMGFVLGSIYEGYLKALTGAWFIDPQGYPYKFSLAPPQPPSLTSREVWQACYAVGVFAMLLMLTNWRSRLLRRRLPLILFFLFWLVISLFYPAIVRGTHPIKMTYKAFLFSNRYRYLPGIGVAAAAALTFTMLRPLSWTGHRAWGRWAVSLTFGLVLLSNAIDVRRKIAACHDHAAAFVQIRTTLLAEVNAWLARNPGELRLHNIPFELSTPVGFLLPPDKILSAYLPAESARRIRYLGPGSENSLEWRDPVFGIRPRGKLFQIKSAHPGNATP